MAVIILTLPLAAQQPPDLLRSVGFREIGPTRQGGRYVDFAVVESSPQVFYAAASTAGSPSVNTAARMLTIWRSPSSAPAPIPTNSETNPFTHI